VRLCFFMFIVRRGDCKNPLFQMIRINLVTRSLVDVNHAQALTRDQCLVYFHVLNERSRGSKIPSELPQDLKSAFAGEYAADLGDRPGSGTGARKGNSTAMSKSAQLADSYVNRLGVASTTLSSKGTLYTKDLSGDEGIQVLLLIYGTQGRQFEEESMTKKTCSSESWPNFNKK
jgi:hypothetical protein